MTEFDGDLRHRPIHEGEKALLDEHENSELLLPNQFDSLRDRRHDSIGQEDAAEGADERGADESAEQLNAASAGLSSRRRS